MAVWKFLKQQDWKYGIPCLLFLACIIGYFDLSFLEIIRNNYLAWHFILTTGFLISYSLKFAGKQNNLFIDRLKLIFYFLYFTLFLLFFYNFGMLTIIKMSLLPFLFYLYFYTILLNYKKDMEEKGKIVQKSSWLIIMIVQSVFILGSMIWAITQKVEAEKQKAFALAAKQEAERAKDYSKEAERLAVMAKDKEIKAKEEALMYREKYEQLIHKK